MGKENESDPVKLLQDWAREHERKQEAKGRQQNYIDLSLKEKFARALVAPGSAGRELSKLSTKACQLDREEKTALKKTLISELDELNLQKQLDDLIRT